ncbi:MAG: tail fiber domain-containing protein [Bacteroidetes bacterium]|nr:tail fiber domain-containing protein [Bacteroidota bacterium]
MKKTKLLCGLAVLFTVATQQVNAQSWSLSGNAGTASTNFLGTTDAKTLKIKTNNATRMVITSNGKIGMGTSAPVSRLDILGTTSTVDPIVNILGKYAGALDVIGLQIESNSSDTGGIGLSSNGNFIGVNGFGNGIGVEGDGNIGVLGFSGYALGALVDPTGVWGQSSGGNVGNGVFGISQSATQNISIWGIATDTSTATSPVDFAGYFQGNVLAWRYYTPSDARLKSNVQPLGSVLSKLNKLETATYNFRTSEYPNLYLPSDLQTGFMAANLQEQFPNLVQDVTLPEKIHPKTGVLISQSASIKVVNYMGMIPVLTAAIQEQQTQIESKNATIETLKSQLTALESKVAAIEAAINNGSSAERLSNPTSATLEQNSPNPFNQSTTIKYFLPENSKNARLTITSVTGVVVSGYVLKGKGNGQVTLNANEFAAGNYTYSLIIDGNVVSSKSLMLTK